MRRERESEFRRAERNRIHWRIGEFARKSEETHYILWPPTQYKVAAPASILSKLYYSLILFMLYRRILKEISHFFMIDHLQCSVGFKWFKRIEQKSCSYLFIVDKMNWKKNFPKAYILFNTYSIHLFDEMNSKNFPIAWVLLQVFFLYPSSYLCIYWQWGEFRILQFCKIINFI